MAMAYRVIIKTSTLTDVVFSHSDILVNWEVAKFVKEEIKQLYPNHYIEIEFLRLNPTDSIEEYLESKISKNP